MWTASDGRAPRRSKVGGARYFLAGIVAVGLLSIFLWGMIDRWQKYVETDSLDARGERILDELGLRPPLEIEKWCEYPDGGSVGGIVAGAQGNRIAFAWDGRVRYLEEGVNPARAPRNLWVGASYPTDPGAAPLRIGSRAEGALIELLYAIGEVRAPGRHRDSLVANYAVLFRYPRPGRVPPEISAEERIGLSALYLAAKLERQILRHGMRQTADATGDPDQPVQ